MSDYEKPKSWNERRQLIKHKSLVPFIFAEWLCEWVSYLLGRWAFLDLLGHAGRLTVLIAVIFYFTEYESRRKANHYQAWQVINAAQGKTGSGGRIVALQDLNKDNVSLAGVDISHANLRGIELKNANLYEANLRGAHLYEANLNGAFLYEANLNGAFLYEANLNGADLGEADFSGADLRKANLRKANLRGATLYVANLEKADLSGADLRKANLVNIKNWQKMKSIESVNISGARNIPEGFVEWATAHGAVSIEDDEEWKQFLREK